jgi:predicted patatin/cPLA2 family phospholipase
MTKIGQVKNQPQKSALILEGGGLRGVYGAGVLRYLMEQDIYLPYVIGVSSGACNGSNYVSRQIERNRIVNIDFISDPRYINYWRWLFKGELFGMDFLFDTLPNLLAPFDTDIFYKSPQKMIVGVSDCLTGEPLYFNQHQYKAEFLTLLRASCSLPFLAPPVKINGKTLMDGGISEAIPIRKSIDDGNEKHVLILTRPSNYRKKKSKLGSLFRWKYPKYKGLCNVINNRHSRYNETLDFIQQLEKKRKIFVFRPPESFEIGRIEKNPEKLEAGYQNGYRDAEKKIQSLVEYLNPT